MLKISSRPFPLRVLGVRVRIFGSTHVDHDGLENELLHRHSRVL